MASIATSEAAIAAKEAHWAECQNLMSTFDSKTATIEVKRNYSQCVYTLYGSGEPLTSGEVILVKIAIALALLMGIVGGIYFYKDNCDDPIRGFFGFLITPVIGFFLIGVIGMVIYGIHFLFT